MSSIATTYSRDLTSYDLLKSFAVIIMVIDHAGYYFFPEDEWWRAIGRIGFPVWFFLVGHASGRGIPWKLWGGALSLIILDYVTNIDVLPLNALVTIIFIRLMIDPIMAFSLRGKWNIWIVATILFLLIIPSFEFTEYGTLGLITAMFGYLVRHRDTLKKKYGHDKLVFEFMLYAYLSFIFIMELLFQFSLAAFAFMALGTFIVRIYLYAYFDKKTYPELTKSVGVPIKWSLQFMGRRTLEIYVVHLFIFQLLALYYFGAPHLVP